MKNSEQDISGEILLLIGYGAAGKTTLVEEYTSKDYHRVNRDELGGKLDSLPLEVERAFNKGVRKFILDNTYVDTQSRKSIIDCGKKLGLPVKCVWLDTSFEDAQFNACQRMIRKAGKLLMPDELSKSKDPNLFPPVALFNYKKKFQPPTTSEGFSAVERVKFQRKKDPAFKNKALIVDYDGTLRTSTGAYEFPTKPTEVQVLPNRDKKLKEYRDKGYLLLGVSNQSGIAKKHLTDADARACFDQTNKLLGVDIEYVFCPHNIPPVVCYCRKPHSGLGVALIEKHKLAREECIFVGDQTTDKTFAARCGFQYKDAEDFFA